MSSFSPAFTGFHSPGAGDEDTARSRRKHRRSRRGCVECKRRHMRCDETRPRCINCSKADRNCFYLNSIQELHKPPSKTPKPSSSTETAGPSTGPEYGATSHSNPPSEPDGTPIETDTEDFTPARNDLLFSMEHLSLLHHFESSKFEVLMANELTEGMAIRGLEVALATPYLMHALLALSALHLATIQPEQAERYSLLATQLQGRSILLFNNDCEQPSETTCLPMFYFSSFIAVHVLQQTLKSNRNDFAAFLDQFANYLLVHRGVNAIVGDWWHIIRDAMGTELSQDPGGTVNTEDLDIECGPLQEMLDHSDLSTTSIQICRDTAKILEKSFRMYHRIAKVSTRRSASIMTFPVHVSAEFTAMIDQQKPEALIILAFYAVLLHRCRNAWIVGDAGRFIIESIAERLQGYWSQWLAFPILALEDDLDS
ncbi:hypothetical protein BGZ61DRAFT_445833 [Ilyonectria robusta]|uniref:uncharacterized protein n=1 Tax=Ilyonectria robusta TaxID=1079257 RepID=UPI001E8D0C3C|nr:uncharacterized protein BGZ61DRAFT_445833 [Ilyonectria robusta]KAH8734125.1 hypothetical protein BGZ61DRAFT_445833 [Ilyonectria robusta]